MKNGIKLFLQTGDVVTEVGTAPMSPVSEPLLTKKSRGWDRIIKKSKPFTMTFNGLIGRPCEAVFKYYFHRGDRYFFRNSLGIIVIAMTDSEVMKSMGLKYGHDVKIEWR